MKRNRFAFFILALGLLATKAFALDIPVTKPAVTRIHIDNFIIHPVTAEYVQKGLAKAKNDGAQALLIVLDTPGGLLESTRGIVQEMLNAEIPIIVYVGPAGARAASAGVFITMASHVAAMAPATHIGAAHPVQLGERQERDWMRKIKEKVDPQEDKKRSKEETPSIPMEEKIMQDTLAWVKNIAQVRNRNAQWVHDAVEKSISSTAEEALQAGVIDLIARDETELLEKLEGRSVTVGGKTVTLRTGGAPVVTLSLNWRQSILNILINPNIAYILLTLGFYGLLFEMTHPGSFAPGVAGLICILLAFYSFHIIPTNYAGVILTATGLILLGVEVFVTSYGLLALGGLACLFFGALFLIDVPADFLKLSLSVAIPTIAAGGAIFGLLLTLTIRSHRRKVMTGEEGMIGVSGVAETPLNPAGKVAIYGEIWEAVSETEESIAKGEKVEILRLENLKLYVRKTVR